MFPLLFRRVFAPVVLIGVFPRVLLRLGLPLYVPFALLVSTFFLIIFKPQAELLEDIANSACGLPTSLNQLAAKEFLYARDRARGIAPLPDFARIAFVDESKSENEKAFNLMKAAVLAIEAALPLGAINATDSGHWRYQRALRWRQMVQNATVLDLGSAPEAKMMKARMG